MNRQALTEALAAEAKRIGLHAIGVAEADNLSRDGSRLADWLARGRHGEMRWMALTADKRADPRELLPGCRSVISCALNYGPGQESTAEPADTTSGRIARYAQGRDYHRVLGRMVRELAQWLETTSGAVARGFVDTAPILERAWAERAGLGWIGKNSNLLTRELGSWLLLGEILSCAELTPAPGPHPDHCGSCTACIEACPTSAIVADGVVDATRCIAYWTIEHRGGTPIDQRAGQGDWLFGCDVCQEVCPWNRSFGSPPTDDPLEWRRDLSAVEAEGILSLDESAFRASYSGTPLMRAKWEGMRRNACVVLGNAGRPGSLTALTRALAGDDAVVRSHAAWALGRLGGLSSRRVLTRAESMETDPGVRAEIHAALAGMSGAEDRPD